MNDRHKQIIAYWGGGKWGGGRSLQETGDYFGVSKQRIDAIIKQHGLEKFPKSLKPKKTSRVPNHGTRSEYSYWGCRCELCKKANADDMKVYLSKKRIKGENYE